MISIAIDGPSGAGKSSLAKALAKDLGYVYVDTGAMYRSIGLYAVRAGVDPHDADAVAALLPQIKLGIRLIDGAQHIYLNGEDVSTAIRAEEIGMAASAVAAHPAVRSFLLDTQRGLAESQNILMDGRDIGTVVLPNATVKIFLTASAEARAQRDNEGLQSGDSGCEKCHIVLHFSGMFPGTRKAARYRRQVTLRDKMSQSYTKASGSSKSS